MALTSSVNCLSFVEFLTKAFTHSMKKCFASLIPASSHPLPKVSSKVASANEKYQYTKGIYLT